MASIFNGGGGGRQAGLVVEHSINESVLFLLRRLGDGWTDGWMDV